jgi:hypothetical protein
MDGYFSLYDVILCLVCSKAVGISVCGRECEPAEVTTGTSAPELGKLLSPAVTGVWRKIHFGAGKCSPVFGNVIKLSSAGL